MAKAMGGEGGERPTTLSFPATAAGRCGGGGHLHSLAANGRRLNLRQTLEFAADA